MKNVTHSRRDPRPHGIMFHHFHSAAHPAGQGSMSGEQLAEMIEFVGRERILSADEWLARAEQGKLREGDLCVTFDDNLLCQYDVALPVLKALDIKPFWFIYTSVLEGAVEALEVYRYFRSMRFSAIENFYQAFFAAVRGSEHAEAVDRALHGFVPREYLKDFSFYSDDDRTFRYLRDHVLKVEGYNQVMDGMIRAAGIDVRSIAGKLWMDRDRIRELAGLGHAIGLHSHSHPTTLAQLPPERQRSEYETNFSRLTELLGRKPICASHPCNSYGPETLQILRDLGIRVAFRANMAKAAQATVLELPREDHAIVLKEMAAR